MNNTQPHWELFIEYSNDETATDDIIGATISDALSNACFTYPGAIAITVHPNFTRYEDRKG